MDQRFLQTLSDQFSAKADQFPRLWHLLISGGEGQPDWFGVTHLDAVADLPPHTRPPVNEWVDQGAYSDVVVSNAGLFPAWSFWQDGPKKLYGYFFGWEGDGDALLAFKALSAAAWRALATLEVDGNAPASDAWDWQRWLMRLYQAAWSRTVGLSAPRQIRIGNGTRTVLMVDELPAWRARTDDHAATAMARTIPDPPPIWSAVLEPNVFLASALLMGSLIESPGRRPAKSPESGVSGDTCTHADDFGWVIWYGTKYNFSKGNQAESVRCLWEAWLRGHRQDGCGLSEKSIGEKVGSQSDRFRLAQAFRRHPAWKRMIRRSTPGCFALFASESP